MCDRFMQKNPEISAFFDTVFSENVILIYANLRFSLKERAKRRVIFADPVSIAIQSLLMEAILPCPPPRRGTASSPKGKPS